MSTDASRLSKEVAALVHHVELNRSGWWDKVVQRLVLAAVWLSDHPPSTDEINKTLLHEFKLSLTHEKLRAALSSLEKQDLLVVLEDTRYRIPDSQRAVFEQDIEAAEKVESDAREFFCKLGGELCAGLDAHIVWNTFGSEFLSPLVKEVGANAYHLITGESLRADQNLVDYFLKKFKSDHHPGLRELITKFLDPKKEEVRAHISRMLHARFCVEASGLPEATIKKLNETVGKQAEFTATPPDQNGVVQITVRAHAETSSLTVNGEEAGGKSDGTYTFTRVAKVGQDTTYTLVATDMYGKTDSKTVTVSKQTRSQAPVTAALRLENLPRRPTRDAVAIIIGIQNYKRVPNADFANADARDFFEYAVRGLGIDPVHTKLLVDEEADDVNIVKAFKNWLPLHVTKHTTEVYVFYSGHGLPSPDGKSLYFLPYGVDKELLARTAVGQEEVIAALVAAAPKSVTMFIDACYSGQTRSGELLLASARPFVLKTDAIAYPANFTVISAASQDQISSSSPELKHGIFSFYLMKGLEGPADGNQDGTITAGEMQAYLSDTVARQAMGMNRQQQTQLVGDAARVLEGR